MVDLETPAFVVGILVCVVWAVHIVQTFVTAPNPTKDCDDLSYSDSEKEDSEKEDSEKEDSEKEESEKEDSDKEDPEIEDSQQCEIIESSIEDLLRHRNADVVANGSEGSATSPTSAEDLKEEKLGG